MAYDFPGDLVQLRRAFDEADATWSRIAAGEVVTDTAGEPITLDQAYRETQRPALELHCHPVLAGAKNGHEV
jgi:hypothetical protein